MRLARIVCLHAVNGNSSNPNLPFPRASNTSAVAASFSSTPRTPALARIGTAPIEGGGSLSLSGGGGSTISSANIAVAGAAAGSSGQGDAAQGLNQGRAVPSVNADFKQFVAMHLSDLLEKLTSQTAVRGGAGLAGGKGGGKGGVSSRGGQGGGGTVAPRRGVGSAASSKRGDEEARPEDSNFVKELSGARDQAKIPLRVKFLRKLFVVNLSKYLVICLLKLMEINNLTKPGRLTIACTNIRGVRFLIVPILSWLDNGTVRQQPSALRPSRYRGQSSRHLHYVPRCPLNKKLSLIMYVAGQSPVPALLGTPVGPNDPTESVEDGTSRRRSQETGRADIRGC